MKLIKIFFITFILFISFNDISFANFQPTKYSIYLENKITNKIKVLNTISYKMKSTGEIIILSHIKKSYIGDKNVFKNWFINQVCIENDCFDKGEISSGLFGLSIYENHNPIKNKYSGYYISNFNFSDLTFSEKINFIYKYIIIDKITLFGFILFLPLNLVVFFSISYGISLLISKFIEINFKIYTFIISFILYLFSTIGLYYFGYSFINFSTTLFGFMTYFYTIGFIKLLLFFNSKDIIRKHKEKFGLIFLKIFSFYAIIIGLLFIFLIIKGLIKNF